MTILSKLVGGGPVKLPRKKSVGAVALTNAIHRPRINNNSTIGQRIYNTVNSQNNSGGLSKSSSF